jgi:dTDP-4-amino-4,6-dideoxygalactose transaminase
MNRKVIPMFNAKISPKVGEALVELMKTGFIGEGEKVVEFTQKIKKHFKCKNVLLLNSGTSALTMAGRLLNLKPGDEIISSPFTMIATNVAFMPFGVKIVWADINENDVNVSVDSIRKKITPNTKAIVVTHVGGVPCNMKKLKEFNIPIVSDCAHSIDTYYQGEHISNWADYSCFSFQSIKQLNTGDGGAIVIKDNEQYERAERLKWFGMTRIVPEGMTRLEHQMTADVPEWGYKFHMNDISATIGITNLECLNDVTNIQINNANFYLKELKDLRGIKLPVIEEGSVPDWWAFYIFVDERVKLMKFLEDKGVITTPMWRRNDRYTTFNFRDQKPLPNMDSLQNKILFIPVGWWVTKKDREYIVKLIKEFSNAN